MSIDLSNKNSYQILGVPEYATNDEITDRYLALKAEYSEARFTAGEVGNDAAVMLQAIENAYWEIMSERRVDKASTAKVSEPASEESTLKQEREEVENSDTKKQGAGYAKIDELIKAGKIDEAQRELDDCSERQAEWHYLQAVIYYKKNWGNECRKQLEIALTKDPQNTKYKDSYEKLKKEMEFKNKNFTSGNETHQQQPHKDFDPYDRQMGGDDCLSSCCQCLACNMLLNCCCNCH